MTTEGKSMSNIKISNKALVFFLTLISLLVYLNTIRNGFVLDDHLAIGDNNIVKKGLDGIPELILTPYHYGWTSYGVDNIYRPVSLVFFAIVYHFFGLDPLPFHVLNILLFAACVVLLFTFLNKLFEGKRVFVAFIAALLFALHPIHTEVVANIKSCDELLCFLFVFSGLILFVNYVNSGKLYQVVAGGLCFILALLSKESAITFAVLIPVIFFFYKSDSKARSVQIAVCVVAVAALYLLLRQHVLAQYHATGGAINMIENALAKEDLPFDTRLATAVWILGYYIRLLFVPYPLVSDYSFNSIPYVHFGNIWVIVSLLVYLFLAGFSVMRLVQRRRDPYALGVLFFLATIALLSNIPFLLGTTMAERFLFMGSVGFCLCLALFIDKLLKVGTKGVREVIAEKPGKAAAILLPIVVVYTGITISRNADWQSNTTLYTHDSKILPDNSRLNYYVANDLLAAAGQDAGARVQYTTEALPYLYRAVAIYPEYALAENDLGAAYRNLNQRDSAKVHFEKAYAINPRFLFAIRNLIALCNLQKDFEGAAQYNKQLLVLGASHPKIYADIGYCYLNMSKYDSVVKYLEQGAKLYPNESSMFYKNLAYTFNMMGKSDSAAKYGALVR